MVKCSLYAMQVASVYSVITGLWIYEYITDCSKLLGCSNILEKLRNIADEWMDE